MTEPMKRGGPLNPALAIAVLRALPPHATVGEVLEAMFFAVGVILSRVPEFRDAPQEDERASDASRVANFVGSNRAASLVLAGLRLALEQRGAKP